MYMMYTHARRETHRCGCHPSCHALLRVRVRVCTMHCHSVTARFEYVNRHSVTVSVSAMSLSLSLSGVSARLIPPRMHMAPQEPRHVCVVLTSLHVWLALSVSRVLRYGVLAVTHPMTSPIPLINKENLAPGTCPCGYRVLQSHDRRTRNTHTHKHIHTHFAMQHHMHMRQRMDRGCRCDMDGRCIAHCCCCCVCMQPS